MARAETISKVFVVGACSGAVVVANWRPIVKRGIKLGIKGSAKLREATVRGIEHLSDVTHEARWELDIEEGKTADSAGPETTKASFRVMSGIR